VSEVFREFQRLYYAEDGAVRKMFKPNGVIHRLSRRNNDQKVFHCLAHEDKAVDDTVRWVVDRMFPPPAEAAESPPATKPKPSAPPTAAASGTTSPAAAPAPVRPVGALFRSLADAPLPDVLRPIDFVAEIPSQLADLNGMIRDKRNHVDWSTLAASADWPALRHVLRPSQRHAGALQVAFKENGSDAVTINDATTMFGMTDLLAAARNGSLRPTNINYNCIIACIVRRDPDVVNRSRFSREKHCLKYHASVLPQIRLLIALFVGAERTGWAFAAALAEMYPCLANGRVDA
jgi:hypothetical protein